MSLFEFLMVLLSIIVGLGLSELLTGFARVLRQGRGREFCIAHAAVVFTIGIALLQVFWESWSLRAQTSWTFPGALLMLGGPILLHLIAHVLFPGEDEDIDLEAYYFSKVRLIWSLALLAVVVGTLFRPVAFGEDLFKVDNLSSFPLAAAFVVLALSHNRILHNVLAPVLAVLVVIDTLSISYVIQ